MDNVLALNNFDELSLNEMLETNSGVIIFTGSMAAVAGLGITVGAIARAKWYSRK